MIAGSLARRYARALFELAQEEGKVDLFGRSLERLRTVIEQVPAGLATLGSAAVPKGERVAAVKEIARQAGIPETTARFLSLLADKERVVLLPDIVREYRRLSDEASGILRVIVTAPAAPDEALLRQAEGLLAARLKKKVMATGRADPELIGGLTMEVDHTVFDGSVRRELVRFKEKMMREEV